MRAFLLLLMASMALLGADDEWAKVKALKTGAELRVYQTGSASPLAAEMGELTADNLLVIVKKMQRAIPRDQVMRVEARPEGGRRITKETTIKENAPDLKDAGPKPQKGPDVPGGSSTSTNVSIGGKPDFETVYRRAVGAPKK